jgi:hypothetical protein
MRSQPSLMIARSASLAVTLGSFGIVHVLDVILS